MKIQISEVDGLILDGLVAIAEGYTLTTDGISVIVEKDGKSDRLGFVKDRKHGYGYGPSTDAATGWEIIHRERICVNAYIEASEGWNACVVIGRARHHHLNGDTGLVAAMRSYLSLKFGREVEVPEVLRSIALKMA
jgi:hypothetical protein